MRISHIGKMPPKSAAFCIRFQLFTVLSLTSVAIKYQLLVPIFHIYKDLVPVIRVGEFRCQCFTCDDLVLIFHTCEDLLPILYTCEDLMPVKI